MFLKHVYFIISLFDLITLIFFLNIPIFQVFLHCPYHKIMEIRDSASWNNTSTIQTKNK